MQDLILVFTISYTTLINLLPYVLFGVLASELLKFIRWADVLTSLPEKAPVLTTILAVCLGIVSPLCTYGTIPIVVVLFRMGFTLQPLVTFLIASSIMNPQLFILTWGGISPELAMARLFLSFLFSVLFGLALLKINQIRIVNPNVRNGDHDVRMKDRTFSWAGFWRNSLDSLQFIGFYIVLGILLGAFIEVYIPAQWFLVLFQSKEWLGVLLGALLGVPLYVCGGGTIPLVNSMLQSGMGSGAALAFFLVGPATRVTPLVALATVIRPRFIGVYVGILIVFAVLAGILFRYINVLKVIL